MDIQSILIAVHAIAASFVILIGPVQFLRRRKDARHRLLGRVFGIMMYFVCLSGMFIYTLDGGFTLFHFLAIFTFTTTTIGIIAIRRRNVRLHRGMMIGSWAGTVTAGAFAALIPGRRIPTLAVDDPALLWGIVAAVLVAATALILIALLAPRRAGTAPKGEPARAAEGVPR
ncbi:MULTISPECIES: DUF2306 domain-containing protein [unclassified Microbacterium]|uniref:DUF2306 domain-containing protein n=1 Tax=unclassified Microbacterium TaxID=2609290 RepID=UPI0012F7FDE1|nr:DUF2306 domain-containing protein [Microbacterium sp. MAH-37]MVQ41585.1 DUF2306 domain-containing protein [Microbacterium sp. MAH-37]